GGSTAVSASSFTRYYTSYSTGSSSSVPSLMSVSASGMARQGDKITINSAAMAPSDDCGMRDMQWFLTTSPGSTTSPPATVVITGESGSGQLRIPADLSAGSYFLEGRLNSKSGRYALIRRQLSTDSNYSLYNPVSGTYT